MSDSSATPSHRAKSRLSRRGAIGAAGGLAAAAVVTPVVFAATGSTDGGVAPGTSDDGTKTEKFPATRSAEATGAGAARVAFPVDYVGLRWSGEQDGAWIRPTDGTWQDVPTGCAAANLDGGGTALVAAASATAYEVKVPEGATDVRSLAIDTTGGQQRSVKVPADTTRVRGVAYLSRAAWGADESKRFKVDGTENSPTKYYSAQVLTVHHTDTPNDDPDPAATVRAVYEYHAITNDWGDIGYHFLIDEAGRIYEGRYSGDDSIPAHDADGNVVTAFHTGGYNSGNLGIALLGTLVDQGPTDAARGSLTRLVAALTRFHGLDPQAKVTYTNPVNGVQKGVSTVGGHRDWMATECPGATMYALLDDVRAAAAER
ncbi:peptidoglycan recognition family protein [Streptomyces sp. NPDC048251]|uniref:peptidoglycan recognition protein family protein n=1 Tax=Streptomyces sp. NPDC048251 TaxID=3154501 RepID=UPI003430324C